MKQDSEHRIASPDDVVPDAVELAHEEEGGQRHANGEEHRGHVADCRSAEGPEDIEQSHLQREKNREHGDVVLPRARLSLCRRKS